MAVFTAFFQQDMASDEAFIPASVVISPTTLTGVSGPLEGIYTGLFSLADNGDILGTVTAYQALLDGVPTYNITGGSVDFPTVTNLLLQGQVQAVFELAFNGDDTFNGSPQSDTLLGYGGNDHFSGLGGDDYIDGGAGFNSASFLDGSQFYTVTATASAVKVSERAGGSDGTDTLVNIQDATFQNGDLNLTWLMKAAALPSAQFANLIELYIATFNRAPDAVGLDFWAAALHDGVSLKEIAKDFFTQPETAAAFPSSLSTQDFVTKVYNNVFGRAPDQAGFDFWKAVLDSGAVTKDTFILAIIGGAQGSDATYLANKVEVGAHFAVEKGLTDGGWAVAVMANVNATAASVAAADQMTDAFAIASSSTDPHLQVELVGLNLTMHQQPTF